MMNEIGELNLAQDDGRSPTTLTARQITGGNGVSLFAARFEKGVHFSGAMRQNLLLFPMSQIHFECRLADRRLTHEPTIGTHAVCPAGIDCKADGEGDIDIVLIAVDQAQLTLANTDDFFYGKLRERFAQTDVDLLKLARKFQQESSAGCPNGPLWWSELSISFVMGLLQRHASDPGNSPPGMLDRTTLRRIKEYIADHLDEPMDIVTLAKVACRSPFHFTRMFARSVGMTPHKYVVRLRLQRALQLIRTRRMGLAHVAAATGFADHAHMSRWFKHVYGISPSQVIAEDT
ncbi:helix-turn-helix domain-containing protein [Bradyrhizobium cenepequi]|uniref:helix-turn-helix domain-containing protein n=1 Tax=Bradyrhizobium cenepequi TaxID=2821403 RepID=UPI001CE2FE1E|nr:AraC family transcriptional regulator [Bradyrhizobium cenepequi]MCA6111183.1 helix-turn-helix transcriptional regulator [Bradyrhizobium cenepequi]